MRCLLFSTVALAFALGFLMQFQGKLIPLPVGGDLGVADSKFGNRINTIVNFRPIVDFGPDSTIWVHLRGADCDGTLAALHFKEDEWADLVIAVNRMVADCERRRAEAPAP